MLKQCSYRFNIQIFFVGIRNKNDWNKKIRIGISEERLIIERTEKELRVRHVDKGRLGELIIEM